MDPSGTEHLKSVSLIRVVLGQEPNVPLLLILAPQVATERVLVPKDGVLQRHSPERLITVHFLHLILVGDSVPRLLLEVSLIWIILMQELAEITSAAL